MSEWKVPVVGDTIKVHHLNGTEVSEVKVARILENFETYYRQVFEQKGVVPIYDAEGKQQHVRFKGGRWEFPYEMTPAKERVEKLFNELYDLGATKARLDTWLHRKGFPVSHPIYLDEEEAQDLVRRLEWWRDKVVSEQGDVPQGPKM